MRPFQRFISAYTTAARCIHKSTAFSTVDSYGAVHLEPLLVEEQEKDITSSSHRDSRSFFNTVLSSFTPLFRLLLFILVPSFIHNTFSRETHPTKLYSTSFLDGIRGYAAFIVAYVHLVPARERWLLPTYGHDETDGLGSSVLQLPFVRALFAARPMVHIFFVISGYVLSCKAIRLIRRGQHEKAASVLSSMIFRRGIRLFLPCIAGIIWMDMTAWFGLQRWQSPTTAWGKIQNIGHNIGILMTCWSWDWENSYALMQLWTIPVEFACSMLLFVVLMGLSHVRPWLRFAITGGIMIHSHASGHWGPFEFLAGMCMAEIEEIIQERAKARALRLAAATGAAADFGLNLPTLEKALPFVSVFPSISPAFWTLIFLFGLFLAGYPEQGAESSFGFAHITHFTPQVYLNAGAPLPSYFWFGISAILILASSFRLRPLQSFFETSLAQYLGKVSYSVYIIHYTTVLVLGDRICDTAHHLVGDADTQITRLMVVALEITMLMILVIWQADLFWRVIDRPATNFARWLEDRCRKPTATD